MVAFPYPFLPLSYVYEAFGVPFGYASFFAVSEIFCPLCTIRSGKVPVYFVAAAAGFDVACFEAVGVEAFAVVDVVALFCLLIHF